MALDYPGGFKVPAFPAGASLAVARWMSVAIMILFLLISVMCGLILWAAHTRNVDPYIYSINDLTGQWDVVSDMQKQNQYSAEELMQMSAVGNFVRNWFLILPNQKTNMTRWAACDKVKGDCGTTNGDEASPRLYGDMTAELCCLTTPELFENFTKNVMPDYILRASAGEFWRIKMDSVKITPTQTPNLWQVYATVVSNTGDFDVLAYALVAQSETEHVLNGGYYVEQFYSYRMDK